MNIYIQGLMTRSWNSSDKLHVLQHFKHWNDLFSKVFVHSASGKQGFHEVRTIIILFHSCFGQLEVGLKHPFETTFNLFGY